MYYADKREMKEFKEKTGLDLDILNEDCYNWNEILYLYGYHGDESKILAHVDSSKLLREALYYMKRRLDIDITKENQDANLKDYSRPKMLMISGHDSTVTSNIILILSSLGFNLTELYHYPNFSSQFALEVRTKKSECSSYSDYYVLGIHDGKELFNVNAQEFIDKLENNLWSEEEVNDFCGFDSSSNSASNSSNSFNDSNASNSSNASNDSNASNSSNDSNNVSNDKDKKDNAKSAYKVLMSIFICLSAILLATTILFAYKYSKANNPIPPLDKKSNYTNITENSFKNIP